MEDLAPPGSRSRIPASRLGRLPNNVDEPAGRTCGRGRVSGVEHLRREALLVELRAVVQRHDSAIMPRPGSSSSTTLPEQLAEEIGAAVGTMVM
eukprot:jgi/Tetstr1/456342/TSEL_043078.t1